MPFTKVGDNDYVSPSGRHFTKKQVRLYYATNGFDEKQMKRMHKRHGRRHRALKMLARMRRHA